MNYSKAVGGSVGATPYYTAVCGGIVESSYHRVKKTSLLVRTSSVFYWVRVYFNIKNYVKAQ